MNWSKIKKKTRDQRSKYYLLKPLLWLPASSLQVFPHCFQVPLASELLPLGKMVTMQLTK